MTSATRTLASPVSNNCSVASIMWSSHLCHSVHLSTISSWVFPHLFYLVPSFIYIQEFSWHVCFCAYTKLLIHCYYEGYWVVQKCRLMKEWQRKETLLFVFAVRLFGIQLLCDTAVVALFTVMVQFDSSCTCAILRQLCCHVDKGAPALWSFDMLHYMSWSCYGDRIQ
jgi:hypothetical protein